MASAELYDPVARTWTLLPNMNHPRAGHAARLLDDGRVLVAGDDSAQVFDPATRTWRATRPMQSVHTSGEAARLAGGRILLAGGYDELGAPNPATEIYDPATNAWTLSDRLATRPRRVRPHPPRRRSRARHGRD